jgi:xanthine dehydrogenase accessory factor
MGNACLGPEADPLVWLQGELVAGRRGVLLTVTAVHGGAPRPVGTHMAVVPGQGFVGYLSGGCVEPAIAGEAERVLFGGRDAILRFGRGSPFIDIRFPCGGGIDVLVHTGPTADTVAAMLSRMAARQPFTLAFRPEASHAMIVDAALPTGWVGPDFHRLYRPVTRLCLAGRGPELEAVARLGVAARYDVVVATPDGDMATRLAGLGIDMRHLKGPRDGVDLPADPFTATVLLFHEREWEDPILAWALGGPSFYIGALGSARTHAVRRERLLATGQPPAAIDRIVGPIGLIPSARDPQTLAVSVLAEIADRNRSLDQASSLQAHG